MRAEGDLDRVGEQVDARQHAQAAFVAVMKFLGHVSPGLSGARCFFMGVHQLLRLHAVIRSIGVFTFLLLLPSSVLPVIMVWRPTSTRFSRARSSRAHTQISSLSSQSILRLEFALRRWRSISLAQSCAQLLDALCAQQLHQFHLAAFKFADRGSQAPWPFAQEIRGSSILALLGSRGRRRLLAQAVARHLVIERRPRDPELARRLRNVALRRGQRRADGAHFGVGERAGLRQQWVRAAGGCRTARRRHWWRAPRSSFLRGNRGADRRRAARSRPWSPCTSAARCAARGCCPARDAARRSRALRR